MSAGGGFSAHVGSFAQSHNHQISAPGRSRRGRNLFVGALENSDAFRPDHIAFSKTPRHFGGERKHSALRSVQGSFRIRRIISKWSDDGDRLDFVREWQKRFAASGRGILQENERSL